MTTKWYLGKLKHQHNRIEKVYLEDFKWDCGWYWGGGYIGNKHFHTHFNFCFLNTPDSRGHSLGNFYDPWTILPTYTTEKDVQRIKNGAALWEDLEFFLDDSQYTSDEWWRIKDLFKQFYTLRDAAEVFQYGGHCTNKGRTEQEIDKSMADKLNAHIKDVIIPEIRKALNHTTE